MFASSSIFVELDAQLNNGATTLVAGPDALS